MRILHYSLGLHPYRSGGLIKYSSDLMLTQRLDGNEVSLLFPGDYNFWRSSSVKIKENKKNININIFQIINPTPPPLLHGIKSPSDFIINHSLLSEKMLSNFYTKVKPEVFHIHTLMGLPLELILFLKNKGVKIIYTTHDYFGLCIKVNFINNEGENCYEPNGTNCAKCNNKSPSTLFLRLRNSKYILKYKSAFSLIKIQKKEEKEKKKIFYPTNKEINDYEKLISYYKKYFILIDFFHFNSNITKQVFEKYIIPNKSSIISITHRGVKDSRVIKKIEIKHVRLVFIGSLNKYKGFPLLKEALCKLNKDGIINWSLKVYGGKFGVDNDCDKIIYKGQYTSDKLSEVFNDVDLLIVPSVWNETFSLITLEAISFGIPVLVSNKVGAKNVIEKYNPEFIFTPSLQYLYLKLLKILETPLLLNDFNQKIVNSEFNISMESHSKEIYNMYLNLKNNK